MITVGMNYEVLPGKEESFEGVFKNVLEVMNEMEGHKHSSLFKDVIDPQNYLIISEWTAREAFEAFTASEKFKKVTNWGKETILKSRPKHEVYSTEDDAAPKPPTAGKCPVSH
jgi:heme-degrading monooxygenase HmoA